MKRTRGRIRWLITVFIAAGIFLGGMAVERLFIDSSPGFDQRTPLFPVASAQERYLENLPDVIEKVVPAVVNISSKKVIKTQEGVYSPFFNDPFFRRFFGDEFLRRYNVPRERVQRNLGSGVIISPDGYILTNNHLVEKAEEVEIVLPDNREFDAKIIGTDPRSDVAVLKIDGEDLPIVPIGDSSELRLGQVVLAVGYPFGVGQTVTMGIVSALSRSRLGLVDFEDFIQTDAAINPGNSGGALINSRGELVGINTAILSRSGGSQGIGFAIPIELANTIMESIIQHGRVIRGWLGVWIQDVTPQLAEAFGLDEAGGVLISDLQEDSPAVEGGLQRDDVVVKYDGRDVENMNHFRQMVATTPPGEKVTMELIREGKKKEIKVKIGEHPDTSKGEADEEKDEDVSPFFVGVGLETLTDGYRRQLDIPSEVNGVLVTEVDRDSPAGEAGLETGDVITAVNRIQVENLDDFERVLKKSKGGRLLLLVYKDGGHVYLLVKP
jgi:serine protease Do